MTIQAKHPFKSTGESPDPITYFEVQNKNTFAESNSFAVGLSTPSLHMNKLLGSDDFSIGLRGTGGVFSDK